MHTCLFRRAYRIVAIGLLFALPACQPAEVQTTAQAIGVTLNDRQAADLAQRHDELHSAPGNSSPAPQAFKVAPSSSQVGNTAPPSIEAMILARFGAAGPHAVRVFRCESGLNPRAKNAHSTAYGIAQFLDSTWRSTGIAKTSDPALQIEAAYRLWHARGFQPWVCRG